MNIILCIAVLTPVLYTLVGRAIQPWSKDPMSAPAILVLNPTAGQLYLLAIKIIWIASPISMIALMIFGDASILSSLGFLILGYISAGALLALSSKGMLERLLLTNAIAPGIFSANLAFVHIVGWLSL